MSPSTLLPETTTALVDAGIECTINNTAPSLKHAINGASNETAELNASKLVFTRNPNPKVVPEPNSKEVWENSPCTDHMVTCSWNAACGWFTPHLEPYGPISLMPTASVLHYATECFEGLKVYRGYDGKLRLFRPDCNTRRMLSSATRIALPAFDPDELQKLMEKLIAVDGDKWLPKSRLGTYLYLRPTMIATVAAIGVQKPREALLYVIAVCFPDLHNPKLDPRNKEAKPGLRLLASEDDIIRAWPGGFGYAKVGANYGPSLIAQAEAQRRGYHQILWLFGPECDVTEAGASNFFVVWRTREGRTQMVTAPLEGKIILDGVTRRSILGLARERLWEEVEVVERSFTMGEILEAVREGRMVEAFAAGTAYFVAPVSEIHFRGSDLEIPLEMGDTGKYAYILKQWLMNIMYGREIHPWGVVVGDEGLGAGL